MITHTDGDKGWVGRAEERDGRDKEERRRVVDERVRRSVRCKLSNARKIRWMDTTTRGQTARSSPLRGKLRKWGRVMLAFENKGHGWFGGGQPTIQTEDGVRTGKHRQK